jgi:drug/metabolite transporter (DMT)-like permease
MRSPAAPDETAEAAQRRARLRGIALMCAANVCFSSIDAIGKLLVQSMSATQVAWARFLGAFVVALIITNMFSRPAQARTSRPWLQIARSILLLSANVFNLYALRFLQLDQALSIMFAAPFLVAAFAVPILGERIGPRRWAAIIVGFFGVLIVTRPGAGGIHPAAALTMMAATSYAFYSIATRVLSHSDSSETTLFYSNLFGAVALSAVVPYFWTTPSLPQAGLMIVMGSLAALGHYLLIRAHRLAPASILSPFMYTQLVWMIFYGYTIFNDLPSYWTLAGASVVIASGLYLLYRERRVKGPSAPVSGDPIA